MFLILMDILTEGLRKEVPESMLFVDDIIDMTEYLDTWRKSLEETEECGLAGRKLNLWISILNRIINETESP